jgi:hypothetical protein
MTDDPNARRDADVEDDAEELGEPGLEESVDPAAGDTAETFEDGVAAVPAATTTRLPAGAAATRTADEPYVDDPLSRWWVYLIFGVFAVIFVYALLFGRGGLIGPFGGGGAGPVPEPTITASPVPSPTAEASPTPAASPEETAAPAESPPGQGAVDPTPGPTTAPGTGTSPAASPAATVPPPPPAPPLSGPAAAPGAGASPSPEPAAPATSPADAGS